MHTKTTLTGKHKYRPGLLSLSLLARADETCLSPYMAKIVGQEEYVYVWTLGMEGVGDEQDKLVTVDANPKSASYGKVINTLSVGGAQRSPPFRFHRRSPLSMGRRDRHQQNLHFRCPHRLGRSAPFSKLTIRQCRRNMTPRASSPAIFPTPCASILSTGISGCATFTASLFSMPTR